MLAVSRLREVSQFVMPDAPADGGTGGACKDCDEISSMVSGGLRLHCAKHQLERLLPVERKVLSPQTQVELAERLKAERPGYRLGDQVHGPWCELIHEENRWWAFVSLPITVNWGDGISGPEDFRDGAKRIATTHAVFADEMIAEAKRRGRL